MDLVGMNQHLNSVTPNPGDPNAPDPMSSAPPAQQDLQEMYTSIQLEDGQQIQVPISQLAGLQVDQVQQQEQVIQ